MKKAIKKKTSIYSYLSKVFESGSDQDIALARKAYWKAYKAAWRRDHTKRTKQFVIALSLDEAKQIMDSARKHRRSPTRFIKDSCFAYLRKRYLVPDRLALSTIHQLLAMNLNTLPKLFDENKMPFDIGRTLLQQMEELEQKVMHELYYPKEQNETVM